MKVSPPPPDVISGGEGWRSLPEFQVPYFIASERSERAKILTLYLKKICRLFGFKPTKRGHFEHLAAKLWGNSYIFILRASEASEQKFWHFFEKIYRTFGFKPTKRGHFEHLAALLWGNSDILRASKASEQNLTLFKYKHSALYQKRTFWASSCPIMRW